VDAPEATIEEDVSCASRWSTVSAWRTEIDIRHPNNKHLKGLLEEVIRNDTEPYPQP